jgi:hypothetical protein
MKQKKILTVSQYETVSIFFVIAELFKKSASMQSRRSAVKTEQRWLALRSRTWWNGNIPR